MTERRITLKTQRALARAAEIAEHMYREAAWGWSAGEEDRSVQFVPHAADIATTLMRLVASMEQDKAETGSRTGGLEVAFTNEDGVPRLDVYLHLASIENPFWAATEPSRPTEGLAARPEPGTLMGGIQ